MVRNRKIEQNRIRPRHRHGDEVVEISQGVEPVLGGEDRTPRFANPRERGSSMSAAPEQVSTSAARTATPADLLLTSGVVVIEQAKVAMSARFGVSQEEALYLLQGLARSQRRELDEFAAEVLRNGGRLDGDLVGDSGRRL
jgi:hypothetical protein